MKKLVLVLVSLFLGTSAAIACSGYKAKQTDASAPVPQQTTPTVRS